MYVHQDWIQAVLEAQAQAFSKSAYMCIQYMYIVRTCTRTRTCTLNVVEGSVDLLQERDEVSAGLPRAVLGPGQQVLACQRYGNAFLLDGGGGLVALLVDAHEQVSLQAVVLKLVALPPLHILVKYTRMYVRTYVHVCTCTYLYVNCVV